MLKNSNIKGWIEYDGKPLESEGSEGNAIDKFSL